MTARGQKKETGFIATTEKPVNERDLKWAERAVKAMLRKLMKNLAEAHERAAVELREAAR